MEVEAWFLLLLIVKCKRKEVAVICLEAEDASNPRSLEEARKDLRAFREHSSVNILSLKSQTITQ